ncbi:hypothetical protein EM595_3022 [Duffyella gerundensis]|uniref:Uncharacterized protein n=1 Tax=Duffyella gerundensis TaxID=1619313 RepID=A0A0U5L849_9GAMM|nr:hypothetical protein EM595_3022 [Duffyella gerundensis]
MQSDEENLSYGDLPLQHHKKAMCRPFDHGTRCHAGKIEVMTQSTYKICLNNAYMRKKSCLPARAALRFY